jgi:hypothetical protein
LRSRIGSFKKSSRGWPRCAPSRPAVSVMGPCAAAQLASFRTWLLSPTRPSCPLATLAALTESYIGFAAKNLGAVARSFALALLYPTTKVLGKYPMEDLVSGAMNFRVVFVMRSPRGESRSPHSGTFRF